MLIEDRNGNELSPGDVVNVRFEVTNIISDSHRRNILVRHFDPQTGLPDDHRLSLDSRTVELLSGLKANSPASSDPEPEPEPEPEPITANPQAASTDRG